MVKQGFPIKLAYKYYSILSSGGFQVLVSKLDLLRFLKWPKTAFFGYVLAFYSIRAVTTLTVVDCGSPRLRITKCGCFKKISAIRGIGPIGMAI